MAENMTFNKEARQALRKSFGHKNGLFRQFNTDNNYIGLYDGNGDTRYSFLLNDGTIIRCLKNNYVMDGRTKFLVKRLLLQKSARDNAFGVIGGLIVIAYFGAAIYTAVHKEKQKEKNKIERESSNRIQKPSAKTTNFQAVNDIER